MHHLFYNFYNWSKKNKIAFIALLFGFLLVFGFFASKIRFEEDITRIIPKNEKSDITSKVIKQLQFSDKITILIEKKQNGSFEDLVSLADEFVVSTEPLKKYIKDFQGIVSEEQISQTFNFVNQNLPLYLDEKDYITLHEKTKSDSIQNKLNENYRSLISPSGLISKDFIQKDPLGLSSLGLKKLQKLSVGNNFILKNGYILTKDENQLLIFINPKLGGSETENNKYFTDELYKIKNKLNKAFSKKCEISYFGSAFIAVANADQIKHDILLTIILSMSLLMGLLIFFYKRFYLPIIIFIPSIFGIVFAISFLYFLRDSISAISLSIGAVLLGVTIDYSLHILTHYKNNSNIKELYKDITSPLLMSSSTTSLAFLCLLFVNSEALIDLGIFASICVIVSAIFSLLLIPHLYKPREISTKNNFLEYFAKYSFEKNKVLWIVSSVVILFSLFTFHKVSFNNNLSDLNFIPEHLKKVETKLEQSTSITSKSIYLVAYGNGFEEALEANNNLYKSLKSKKYQNKILNINSISQFVFTPNEQEQKLKKWDAFWREKNKSTVINQIINENSKLGIDKNFHKDFFNVLQNKKEFSTIQEIQNQKIFGLDELIAHKDGLFTITTLVKIKHKDRNLLAPLFEKEAKIIMIDRQHLNETFLGKLRDDFNSLVNYSTLAVILILFVFFRRIELVIMSTIPILLTGIVTGGIMWLFNIPLNIFSTIVCTLVFGHGIDFSIFMTSAMQRQHTDGKNELSIYRTSILLAVITTILAIGALVFAKHPALKSISSVSLIGVFAALIITFIFYPILFNFCITNRVKKGLSPVTLRQFLFSLFSFIYYGLGGFILTLFAKLVLWMLPMNKTKKQLFFGKMTSSYMASVLHTNFSVSKKIVNQYNEKFEKPCLIIANHTSSLDTITIGFAYKKIIFLVNDWVYNSPVFGKIAQTLGFYPVSQGIENSINHLNEKIEQGFSLVIFPEGTRSQTNEIMRFHKGAFYLAHQLNLDIVPIYIHGNSEVIPKNDYIIYDGKITVEIGKRILSEDFNKDFVLKEKTKEVSHLFREEFAKIRQRVEDAFYFHRKIELAYFYKEPNIIKEVKSELKKNALAYHKINQIIPKKTKILHIGNHFGQLDQLLLFSESTRSIISFIENIDQRNVAKTLYFNKIRNIDYIDNFHSFYEEVTQENKPKDVFDFVILSNMTKFDWNSLKNITYKKVILLNSNGMQPENLNVETITIGIN